MRQRLAAGVALLAFVALFVFVLVPVAPCWAPGGDRCPPEDEAIALVPGEAAAYAHINLDPDTDQLEAATEVTDRLPTFTAQAITELRRLTGTDVDFQRDVAPWTRGEAAVALIPSIGEVAELALGRRARNRPELLQLFEVEDTAGAEAFAAEQLGPETTETEREGAVVRSNSEGLSSAITMGFLLLGPTAQVEAAIDVGLEGGSLASDPAATRARAELPDDRLFDVYASGDLVRSLERTGTLGSFETFVNAGASEGAAAALSFSEDELELTANSTLDPDLVASERGFLAALAPFEPELDQEISGDALVYLGVGDPGASAAQLVDEAASTAPELFSGLRLVNKRLQRTSGANIQRDLLPLLEGEAALTVEPPASPGQQQQAEPDPSDPLLPAEQGGPPYLALLASGVDAERAQRDLAELQRPLAAAIDPRSGQTPVFETREISGVQAQSLRLSRVVDLTYAAFDDQFIVGSSPLAVERTRAPGETLAESEPYEEATDGFPDEPSLLLYLDFENLLALGERLFLAEDPAYARVATDLRAGRAAALAVTREEQRLTTNVRVGVGEVEPPQTAPPAVAPESG